MTVYYVTADVRGHREVWRVRALSQAHLLSLLTGHAGSIVSIT